MDSSWFVQFVAGFLHLFVGEQDFGEIVEIKESKTPGMMKILLKFNKVQRLVKTKFTYGANALCSGAPKPFKILTFIKYWEDNGLKQKRQSTDSDDSSSTGNNSNIEIDEFEADSTLRNEPTQQCLPKNYENEISNEYKLGTFDVHVENLVQPNLLRATRILDHSHVEMLINSFVENSFGQLVIIAGMVTDLAVEVTRLNLEGTGTVEVLGGNHTREALQALHRKDMLSCSTIRVDLYKPLPRILALRLGYAHNTVLHEKNKPLSFIDKVRLMRDCRPAHQMAQKETKEWQDSLATVFGVKDRRILAQSYGVHLSLAAIPADLWRKLSLASDKFAVTNKFFRQFNRLSLEEDKEDCLDVLLSEGINSFKEKVQGNIDAGHVKRIKQVKSKKQGINPEAEVIVVDDNRDNDSGSQEEVIQEDQSVINQPSVDKWKQKYTQLMAKCEDLEVENGKLREQVKTLTENQKDTQYNETVTVPESKNEDEDDIQPLKRRRVCPKNRYKKGDHVMAFWRDEATGEESWQEAMVLYAYSDGKCKVQWESDRMISFSKEHEIQPLNQ